VQVCEYSYSLYVWQTNIGISDAAYQLEGRIRHVEGIMSLGFETRCKYSMKIVPQIGKSSYCPSKEKVFNSDAPEWLGFKDPGTTCRDD